MIKTKSDAFNFVFLNINKDIFEYKRNDLEYIKLCFIEDSYIINYNNYISKIEQNDLVNIVYNDRTYINKLI
jgi:hypothetical protein